MEETGYAKLNLALHVRGREADGYHRIETLFAFCEDGDRLRVRESDGLTLEVQGAFAAQLGSLDDNLVLRAAHALRGRCGIGKGAALLLDKRLPVAAGIGGGSADAAAALRLLSRFWGLGLNGDELLAFAAGLGADVPACVASRTVRGEGRGDRLRPADAEDLERAPVLLVNPGVALATADIFAAWDGVDRGPLGDWRNGRNDLEAAAMSLAPQIRQVLDSLAACEGAALVRMSGSGATCFALFANEEQRDAAARSLRRSQPGWWQLASRLR